MKDTLIHEYFEALSEEALSEEEHAPKYSRKRLRAYLKKYSENNGVDVFEQWQMCDKRYYKDRVEDYIGNRSLVACRCGKTELHYIFDIQNVYNHTVVENIGSSCILRFLSGNNIVRDTKEALREMKNTLAGKCPCLVSGCRNWTEHHDFQYCGKHDSKCMECMVQKIPSGKYAGRKWLWCIQRNKEYFVHMLNNDTYTGEDKKYIYAMVANELRRNHKLCV